MAVGFDDDLFAILVPAAGRGAHLALDVSETPVQDRHPDDLDSVGLAHPAGNRFCVIDTGHS